MRQSRELADALARTGIRSRDESQDAYDIDHVTGEVALAERFRPVKFLPLVAQRDSAAMLSALRYWMHHHVAGRYVRMATITGGARVPALGDLRGRATQIARTVSKWAFACEHDWQVSVVFRSTEFTRRDLAPYDQAIPAGSPTADYHVHAHVLYTPRRFMADGEWELFLVWSEAFFRARLPGTEYGFSDAGRIEEPDESCKYAFKPEQLNGITDAEVRWLFEQCFRANLKQPLREFKTFRKDLEGHTREAFAEQMDPDTGEITEHRFPVAAPLKIVSVWSEGAGSKPRLEIVHKRPRPRSDREPMPDDERPQDDELDRDRAPRVRENFLLFTGNPSAGSLPYATARSRVVGFTTDPQTQEGKDGLAIIRMLDAEYRDLWERQGAPPVQRVPLELDLWAAQTEGRIRAIDAELKHLRGVRHAYGDGCARSALEISLRQDRRALHPLAGRARVIADRLRAAAAAKAAPFYEVHTCSLSVPAERHGTDKLQVEDVNFTPLDPPELYPGRPKSTRIPAHHLPSRGLVGKHAREAHAEAYRAWRADRDGTAKG